MENIIEQKNEIEQKDNITEPKNETVVTEQPKDDNDILSDNKVGVDIVPRVNGNTVTINLCSCAITLGFSNQ